MQAALPDRLDLVRLADVGAVLEGEVPITQMSRLAALVSDAQGGVRARLEFGRTDGRETVRGQLAAELTLICQRCLGPVQYPVRAQLDLVRVASEAEAVAEDDGRDPLFAPEREVATTALVEDEILLALPLAPVHADPSDCIGVTIDAGGTTRRNDNPFAVLAALKKN